MYNEVSAKHRPITYYRTPAGVEVDFVIETAVRRPQREARIVALEVKRAERWDRRWEKPMRALDDAPGVEVDRMIGVYCGKREYRFDRVQVLPLQDFIAALFSGDVF